MGKFWHKTGHILAHVGLGALQVANVAWPFVPFPFNLAVAGGAATATAIIAATHKATPPPATTGAVPAP
jgi:hypothetical protein